MPDMSASVSPAMTHFVLLAKEVDENKVTPGVLGFIVFAAMALAVWGLMKSMSKHMNRVDFKEPGGPSAQEAPASAPAAEKPAKG
ncbi:hypothetical protein [Streptomyces acidiscabies]|uniref:Uncharacterized protein n=2 Tax=Streptomyces acidiscabies TaxID=42234 RepID=A0AAP6BK68_9ACTN|nr:hypothetical protein [Streptomyces acidiscabies]MBP5937281.1 hypothetical protein [Streptomyces sp. LBUM 1476]MBZ3914660.1 hypothetical protein [Streptomyces acidiscabies]MDX2966211.1 hypothetical protein [Streptomyces acidiscabies]MDX3025520.1 hypothetical protein [Streptomyces acidiscabies]MDX3796203.1 hypothetical protein [Streptomyces acidiscabies]